MPSISAYGKTFRNWEGVIGAVNENLSRLPGAESLRDELVAIINESKALKVEQENLAGLRKAATQRLEALRDEAWDKFRRLQALVKSHLGPKSEQLPQFGVAPDRPRSKQPKRNKKKAETPANPPAPETAANNSSVAVKAAE